MGGFLLRVLCGTVAVIAVALAVIIWTEDVAPWLARKGRLP